MIKCILSPVNPNRNPMTIKSNKDQLTCLEKMFPKSGINNNNRGENTLLITVKFMIKYFCKNKLHFINLTVLLRFLLCLVVGKCVGFQSIYKG